MSFDLDPETRAWVRAAAAAEPRLSSVDRERLRLAVLGQVAASLAVPSAAAPASASAAAKTAGTVATTKLIAIWFVAGTSAGLALAGGTQLVQSSREPTPIVTPSRPAPRVDATRAALLRRNQPPSDSTPPPEPLALEKSQAAVSPSPTVKIPAAPRSSSGAETREPSRTEEIVTTPELPRSSVLAEELRLMNELQAALRDGSIQRAEELIARHAREYPTGQFRLERLAAQVFAACQRGDQAHAERAAESFLATDSSSGLAARVRASCAGFPRR